MQGHSLDLTQDLLAQLKAIVPQAFTEDKLDVAQLKTLLGETAFADGERYGLSWAGKTEAYKVLQRPTTATLIPNPEDSEEWENAPHVLIEGENLEVLKVLQKSYYGKVKMIYIDPPYNTGNDSFIYPDKFSETKEEYLRRIGDKDEEGRMMKQGFFRKNSKENGQFHSNWLNMMLPRLFLARNLLKEDGVIFVSIDDNEQANLKLLMDEIFGEENFVGQWNWFKSATPPNLSKKIKKKIEYILCYHKGGNNDRFKGIRKKSNSDDPISKPQNTLKQLVFQPNQLSISLENQTLKKGVYGTDKYPNKLLNDLIIENQKNKNTVVFENRFTWTQSKLEEEISNGTSINLSKNLVLSYKKSDYEPEVPPNLIDKESGVDTTENAGKLLINLFDGIELFDYPKPVSLLKYLTNFCCTSTDIILDFFAGSGTLAQAVLELNEEDGGKRQYICVQLPEATDEKSEAYKAGYKSIAEITQARIKKVIAQIKAKRNGALEFAKFPLLGFRKYTLASSNFKIWRGDILETEEDLLRQMDMFTTPQRPESQTENILWELLIKNGIPLTEAIQTIVLEDGISKIYHTPNKRFAFVLDHFTQAVQDEVLQLAPKTVICLDSLFKGRDTDKTNAQLKFEDNGITFKTV